MLGSVLAGAAVMADTSVTQDAKSASGYMGHSAITAKVKSALVGNKAVNNN